MALFQRKEFRRDTGTPLHTIDARGEMSVRLATKENCKPEIKELKLYENSMR